MHGFSWIFLSHRLANLWLLKLKVIDMIMFIVFWIITYFRVIAIIEWVILSAFCFLFSVALSFNMCMSWCYHHVCVYVCMAALTHPLNFFLKYVSASVIHCQQGVCPSKSMHFPYHPFACQLPGPLSCWCELLMSLPVMSAPLESQH